VRPGSEKHSSGENHGFTNESSSGTNDLELIACTDINALGSDLSSQIELDVDFNFDTWSPQDLGPDIPLDITWPPIDDSELSPLSALGVMSDSFSTSSLTSSSPNLAPLLQDYQTATTSFPDTYLLPIPALTLLRACRTIAARLGIVMQLWDCASISPFYINASLSSASSPTTDGGSIPSYIGSFIDTSTLPENLQPTRTQRLVPHHPLLDVLPWPSVRDKLILFFSQPAELRPAVLDMGQLVADLEDEAEGVVINDEGTEPWEAARWEVGGALRRRWWFALDSAVKRR
jgi:hypothetical protein